MLLIILLILLLGFGGFGYRNGYGGNYYSGGIGTVLIIALLLYLLGYI